MEDTNSHKLSRILLLLLEPGPGTGQPSASNSQSFGSPTAHGHLKTRQPLRDQPASSGSHAGQSPQETGSAEEQGSTGALS